MYYYKVLVASARYHGSEALAYASAERLHPGQVVRVALQRQKVLGVIEGRLSTKPAFATKEIDSVISALGVPAQLLKLTAWLRDYYPAPLGVIMQLLLPSTLMQTSRQQLATAKPSALVPLPPLTTEQQHVVNALSQTTAPTYLHGDTGTGKTRVYQELAAQSLKKGRSVLILTPEIGLTPQLAEAFEAAFGRVIILHSNLTPVERRQRWLEVLAATEPLIIIGPRSALFAPLKNLGLLVMDEAHDYAYKQEQQPYYQTVRVAAVLAKLHHAQLILGTATPVVADYYTFQQKDLPIIRMQQPALQATGTTIELIDLKDRTKFTRSFSLSNELIEAISTTIKRQEQVLIFLNRRGTARLVLCGQCGWSALCPRCDLNLTYHGDKHLFRCHVCNYSEAAKSQCPTCGSPELVFRSVGTKTLTAEVERLFPEALVKRFDTDVAKPERLEQAYEHIRAGKVDILVGTQMLAKGLDLPRLSLVGIVSADSSLALPDFSAEEHSYQLLSQIIGRVGRGHRPGQVLIQSYDPSHASLQAAVKRDYRAFYEQQLVERQAFGYPPFVYLLKLTVSRATAVAAEKAVHKVAAGIQALEVPVELVGPSPTFYEKTHGKYHWQLVIKAKHRPYLLRIIRSLPANITYDIDPVSLI